MGIEQSRRDDLESLGYVIFYLLREGGLPWQGMQGHSKRNKYQRILERKQALVGVAGHLHLTIGYPSEFRKYFVYCLSLKFEDKPDYE